MRVPSLTQQQRRIWKGLLPLFVCLVVVAEIAFLGRLGHLGRLGMAKNAFMVHYWDDSFFLSAPDATAAGISSSTPILPDPLDDGDDGDDRRCEVWLETEDAVSYSRDFRTDPIVVAGAEQKDWASCSVGCKFGSRANKEPDAAFNLRRHPATASILRSMESSHYYVHNNINMAWW